eukprot:Nk52_evm41s207 gene=Nk52_evmTU41s207
MSGRWYFTKEQIKDSPSRKSGIPAAKEAEYRVDGAAVIQDIGMNMKLPQLTIATAVVFFHRFYMYQSFKEFSRWDMGICCLFLAGKVEETPKKLRDILIAGHKITHIRRGVNKALYKPLQPDSKEFMEEKEKLLQNERMLLQTLGFDLSLEHPYQFLLNYVKALKGNKELAQTSWNYLNDCLRTTVCLQHPPQRIATGVILLAATARQYELSNSVDGRPWWKVFAEDVEYSVLEDIGHQILNVYPVNKNGSGKPILPKKRQNEEENASPSKAAKTGDSGKKEVFGDSLGLGSGEKATAAASGSAAKDGKSEEGSSKDGGPSAKEQKRNVADDKVADEKKNEDDTGKESESNANSSGGVAGKEPGGDGEKGEEATAEKAKEKN